MARRCA